MTIQQLKDNIASQLTTFFTSKSVATRDKVKKAVVGFVVLDEINILRTNASLSERTVEQLKTAVTNKYDALGG